MLGDIGSDVGVGGSSSLCDPGEGVVGFVVVVHCGYLLILHRAGYSHFVD